MWSITDAEIRPDESVAIFMEDGEYQREHRIAPEVFASWSELLGITDTVELIDAMLHVSENGEPEPDPVTGENAWTAPYQALMAREQTIRAEEIGQSEQLVRMSSDMLAARKKSLVNVAESAIEEARASAREALGLSTSNMRLKRVSSLSGDFSTADSDPVLRVANVIDDQLSDRIAEAREEFLDSMRPGVAPEEEPDG